MKRLLLSLCFVLIGLSLNAQVIQIDMGTTFNTGTEWKFDWDNTFEGKSKIDQIILNYELRLSAQIYKPLFLKTKIGSNDIRQLIEMDYTAVSSLNSNTSEYYFSGWVDLSQSHITILPELRPFKNRKWFYANIGVGLHQIRSSKLLSGTYGNSLNDFSGFDGRYLSFEWNIGVNLFYKNIGLFLDMGRRYTEHTKRSATVPGIGFKQKTIAIGVAYHFEVQNN